MPQRTQTININNDQEHNDIYRSAASVGHETEEALTRYLNQQHPGEGVSSFFGIDNNQNRGHIHPGVLKYEKAIVDKMPNSEGILRLKNHRNKYHEYDILDPDVMAAYQKSVDDADLALS